jgi:hypothetical protein
VTYPREEVREVLGRTLGVPLFQEQAMQLAIVAAGFTPDEADALRKAMAAWKRKGDQMVRFGKKLIDGMLANGYPQEFAERCFEQVKGFSEYGFPESHAASFALLVYESCRLKRYYPAAFACALINSQPMGFYQPSQIVRDAREHGVSVRAVDVNRSDWDCTLEASACANIGGVMPGLEVRGVAARGDAPPSAWGVEGVGGSPGPAGAGAAAGDAPGAVAARGGGAETCCGRAQARGDAERAGPVACHGRERRDAAGAGARGCVRLDGAGSPSGAVADAGAARPSAGVVRPGTDRGRGA